MPLDSFLEHRLKPLVLLDGNSAGYMAYFAMKAAGKLDNYSVFKGLLAILASRLNAHKRNCIPLVVWDEVASPTWREGIFSSYKASRRTEEKLITRQDYEDKAAWAKEALSKLGIAQASGPGLEADDIAYWAGLKLGEFSHPLELVSKDSDWWQGVSSSTFLYDLQYKRLINQDNFQIETGFTSPSDYIIAKCLAGDQGDSIPGIDKVGLKTAVKYLTQFGSIDQIWNQPEGTSKILNALINSKSIYVRNRQLIDWAEAPSSVFETLCINLGVLDPDFENEMLRLHFEIASSLIDCSNTAKASSSEWTWLEPLLLGFDSKPT